MKNKIPNKRISTTNQICVNIHKSCKISELIEFLQSIKNKYGDIQISLYNPNDNSADNLDYREKYNLFKDTLHIRVHYK